MKAEPKVKPNAKLQVSINFRMPSEMLAMIDAARGDVPRIRYLRRLIEGALNGRDGGPLPHD